MQNPDDAVFDTLFSKFPERLRIPFEKYKMDTIRVLDVGCSYGHVLYRCGKGSQGITSIKEQAEYGRNLGLDIVIADIGLPETYLGRLHNDFDIILFSDVIEHLVNPHTVLYELSSKLKDEGKIVCLFTTKPSNAFLQFFWEKWFGYRGYDSIHHYYLFNVESASFLFEHAGYRIIESYPSIKNRMLRMILKNNFTEHIIIAEKYSPYLNNVKQSKKGNIGITDAEQ